MSAFKRCLAGYPNASANYNLWSRILEPTDLGASPFTSPVTPKHVPSSPPPSPDPGYSICGPLEEPRRSAPAPGVRVERNRFATIDSQYRLLQWGLRIPELLFKATPPACLWYPMRMTVHSGEGDLLL